jgi:hypothetical protein
METPSCHLISRYLEIKMGLRLKHICRTISQKVLEMEGSIYKQLETCGFVGL